MTSPSPPPDQKRRIIVVIALLAAWLGWLWMQFDQRFVGTWTTELGSQKMVISSDGKVDGFFVIYSLGEGLASHGAGAPSSERPHLFKIRGKRFDIVAIPPAASSFESTLDWLWHNTETGFNTTEQVIYTGEIVSVDANSFTLSIDGTGPIRYVRVRDFHDRSSHSTWRETGALREDSKLSPQRHRVRKKREIADFNAALQFPCRDLPLLCVLRVSAVNLF